MKINEKDLLNNIGKIAYTLDKTYISRLTEDYGVFYFDEKYNKNYAICYENNIRALKVERWVFDENEKPGECFKNVLSLFADGDHTIALVIKRTPTKSEMYFVIKNDGLGRNEDSKNNISLLNSSILGNFPGTHTSIINYIEDVEELFSFKTANSISVLANTPSEYSEDYITQGLDKLLNGIVPKTEKESYSVVFMAESLTQNNIREVLSGFEDIATAIYPFVSYQFQVGENETNTKGEMHSIASTESISNSVFKTQSINIGENFSISNSRTKAISSSLNSEIKLKEIINFGASIGVSLANTLTGTIGQTLGYGYSWGKSKTVSNGSTDTSGISSSISIGKSENTSYSYKSYMVANLVEKLEKTMKRINESQATGLWKYSTYVLASDSKTSKNVANYLRAVTQGKDSFVEPSTIQEWSREEGNISSAFSEIKKYVTHFTHPIFVTVDENGENGMMVTPTSYVATDELSNVFAFPRKSVQGLPVLECVQFGREPHSLIDTDADLDIGSAYHMHEIINSQRISISKEELTKHTFITGSTGSGKSNTIYKLLDSLNKEDVNFLVVEPAKGEYKTVFGNKNGVSVYGTNPNLTDMKMLHINPFRFPKSIHILEHLDRLIEIFNVCWPMYAAMPAILKDAVERAYIASGWDLMKSKNKYDDNIFPTFSDVLKQIKVVLDESEYSSDNKGDYTGSLVTRVKSLTNGINGLIFTTDDISDEQLFDRNVIVDLSRVGSTETKALMMGLLVLKLHEYRMDNSKTNSNLRHVTVLEEAHNLLKRTSTEQTNEGANLLGKSVEMLSNSIAEMRTFGEGFIIADQSPGLLDMSVIRNTNTKIILRLPDFSDRELVGKAAGLNDKQIIELGRLEKGVASITQSDWLEPVLCKIDKFDDNDDWSNSDTSMSNEPHTSIDKVENLLLECIMNKEIYRKGDRVDIQKLKDMVLRSNLETSVKCKFIEYITSEKENLIETLQKFVFEFLNADKAIESSRIYKDINEWSNNVVEMLNPSIKEYSEEQINMILALIICEQAERDNSYNDILVRFTEINKGEKGIL